MGHRTDSFAEVNGWRFARVLSSNRLIRCGYPLLRLGRNMFGEQGRISTDQVDPGDAVDFWRSVVEKVAAPVTLAPEDGHEFYCEIVPLVATDSVDFTWLRCTGQLSTRAKAHISRAEDAFVVAVVELAGVLPASSSHTPGAMTLFDTARPAQLAIESPRTMLVLRADRGAVAERSRHGRDLFGKASIEVPASAAAVVIGFLTSVIELTVREPRNAETLIEHTPGLLAAAIDIASGHDRPSSARDADLQRELMVFLHANYHNPDLTVDDVAAALLVSRRTLFRIVGSDGVAGRLRRLRVEHARRLLRRHPDRPISVIAGQAGFRDERSLYRTFRREESMTPTEYRAHATTRENARPGLQACGSSREGARLPPDGVE